VAQTVWQPTRITTATTTNIPASILHSVVVNAPGTSMTVTLRDGVGGTIIAVITVPSAFLDELIYDATVTTGTLSVVTGGTLGDITVLTG